LSEGLSNREIAARIGISESTVRQGTMVIHAFLGAKVRREAVAAARLRCMVNPIDCDIDRDAERDADADCCAANVHLT
jgi:hypothetical protein